METMIFFLLVAMVVIAIKLHSDISHLKGLSELNFHELKRMRSELKHLAGENDFMAGTAWNKAEATAYETETTADATEATADEAETGGNQPESTGFTPPTPPAAIKVRISEPTVTGQTEEIEAEAIDSIEAELTGLTEAEPTRQTVTEQTEATVTGQTEATMTGQTCQAVNTEQRETTAQTDATAPLPGENKAAPQRENWERRIGVNLFSKIGILVLIVGIGYFVKYAIDRDWINEVARTALGMCTGFALWGIAYRIREQYRNFSSILAGGGFAICFICIAIAFHLYDMFPATAAFVALIALTAVMTGISLRFDRQELAVVSIVGGFAAPFIASDGGGSFVFVLSYMALLNTAMLGVTLRKNWWTLPVLSCWLTYIICSGGYFSDEFDGNHAWGLAAIVYYFILFAIPLTAMLNRNTERPRAMIPAVSATVVNSIAYLSLGTYLAGNIALLSHVKGLIGLLGAAVSFGIYLKYYLKKEEGLAGNLLITLTAGFALAAILIQFTSPNVCIAAAGVEAAMMSWLYFHTGRRVFKVLALIIGLTLTGMLSIVAMAGISRQDAWGFIVTGIAFVWSAYTALERRHLNGIAPEELLSTGALWGGCVIGVAGASAVCGHYFNPATSAGLTLLLTAITMLAVTVTTRSYRLRSIYLLLPGAAAACFAIMSIHAAGGPATAKLSVLLAAAVTAGLYLRCAGDAFSLKCSGVRHIGAYMIYFNIAVTAFAVATVFALLDMTGLQHLRSAGLSVALTGCAATQMALGMRHHNKLLRIVALCVFGIVIAKLVAYDMWKMAAVGRIVVFILLGVILLAVSFLYQRLRGVLIDERNDRDNRDEA